MRFSISASTSPILVDFDSQVPDDERSASRTEAGSVVTPLPDFFWRACSGLRVMRRRRPPIVASSSTSVAVRAWAWSERRRLAPPRSPGTRP